MKVSFVLALACVFIGTTAAFKVRIHSDAKDLADKIAKRIESAISTKNDQLVRAQFHNDFYFVGCHQRLSLAATLRFLDALPEDFKYRTTVLSAHNVGHKSVKFAVEWAFDSHSSTYEFLATRHHGQYILEKGRRVACVKNLV